MLISNRDIFAILTHSQQPDLSMQVSAFSTFVNYLGNDLKEGRHKASVNSHIAKCKHAHRRRDKTLLRSKSDNGSCRFTWIKRSPSALPRSHSLPEHAEVDEVTYMELYSTKVDDLTSGAKTTNAFQLGPPPSLSPYNDFFHLLLPPAFFGIRIPANALVPEADVGAELMIRKFGKDKWNTHGG